MRRRSSQIFGLDGVLFERLTAAGSSTSCIGGCKWKPRADQSDTRGNPMHYVSYAIMQSTKGRTRTHDIAGQPPDPLNTSCNFKSNLCHPSYLTGGKPSSENGSHAHGCIIQSKDVVCRNLCSWSFSFCLWIGKQYFTSRYRVSERLTATSTKRWQSAEMAPNALMRRPDGSCFLACRHTSHDQCRLLSRASQKSGPTKNRAKASASASQCEE